MSSKGHQEFIIMRFLSKNEKKEVVESTANGFGASYDWDTILDPRGCELEAGTDYKAKTGNFANRIKAKAKAAGKSVKITKTETGLRVVAVDATGDESTESAE